MNRKLGEYDLPDRQEAIATVSAFMEQDPVSHAAHIDVLAGTLGTMSLAVSSLALQYGEEHPIPQVGGNMGIWTQVEENGEHYEFVTMPQDVLGLSGAHVWKTATQGGINRYHDSAVLPIGFAEPGAGRLRQPQHPLQQAVQPWHSICAEHIRAERHVIQRYRPFRKALEADRPTRVDAEQYVRILQDLSATLIRVTDY